MKSSACSSCCGSHRGCGRSTATDASGGRPAARTVSYVAAITACAAATTAMVALRESLGLATVSLIYLLTVFLCAVWWGRGPGLAASLLSFLALNFFFTPPYHTFRVASPENVIGLLVFLLVAEMTARVV